MSDEIELDIPEDPDAIPKTQPEEVKTVTVETPSVKNAIQSEEYRFLDKPQEGTYSISMPTVPRDELAKQMSIAQKNTNIDLKKPEMNVWKETTEQSINSYTPGLLYQNRFRDPQSMFTQGILKSDGNTQGISRPKFKANSGELKGEAAILQVSKSLGLGDTLTIPLPHSGIVVTVKPPQERALVDFYNTIYREKIYLGRITAGLTLTNMAAYINSRLFSFILAHVHSLNYKDMSKEKLGDYISLHDFHILAWGFAATQYPNGFDFERACTYDVEKCTHIEKGVINMLKLLWVDNTQLSEVQKQILLDYRPNQQDLEQHKKYMADHTRVRPKAHTLKNGMIVHLKVPTFNEHISDGMGWVSRINSDIERLITDPETEQKEKTDLLTQYVNATILRQFSHFIDFIELSADDGGSVITHRETINSTLELLSSDDKIRPELTQVILDYKSDTTIALIGLPSYKCPSCGNPQNTNPVNERLVDVIPIDVMFTFFTLLTLRMSKILERE
ncbi:hypothetical protein [Flavobacterium sp.]|jgi:hypothetical protein|uniref:hypothetical protein n=1 Tax=Flavobacterium sp. TaxID=239 RepID=UPI0037C06659